MFTQIGRLLTVHSPLGEDSLLLESLEGDEALSQLFHFRLELLSEEHELQPESLVGKELGIEVGPAGQGSRRIHGMVMRFSSGGLTPRGLRRYHAHLVPWLWFLSKRRDCRIFQHKTVLEIVSKVFESSGFKNFEVRCDEGGYPLLDYCVQYNETDLDFVHRLLEEFGIYYFFRHEMDRHVLVLADSIGSYVDCLSGALCYHEAGDLPDTVQSWERQVTFVSGRWTHTDYDFQRPRLNLISDSPTVLALQDINEYEQYEYPGRHLEFSLGEKKARNYMEAEEASHWVVRASSNSAGLYTAGRFCLASHPSDGECGEVYLVTALSHSAREGALDDSSASTTYYQNRLSAIPASQTFRPQRRTPKPRMYGPQTAVVVGPPGEEIYTDAHGRIKVQFHWDRAGKRDENSSCWMRVAQPWAGANFGGLVLPRVGHEVVVEFLEGDPDRPIVHGSVFNADNPPPQDLPAGKASTTIRSKSLGGGGGGNEISMTDTKGQEGFLLHAQYDLDESVLNDRRSKIGNNETQVIGNDRSTQISSSDSLQVGVNSSEQIGADKQITAGSNILINAGSTLTLRCGAASITMTQAGIINISGTMVNVSGSMNANVTAPVTNVTGSVLMTATGAVTLVSGAVTRVTGSSLMHIGGSKIESIASGDNLIQGAAVKLN